MQSKAGKRATRAATLGLLLAAASLGAAEAATRIGWVWAYDPSNPSYTATGSYVFNSAGGDVNITRSSPGQYNVQFTQLGNSLTDNVLITPYSTSGYCSIGNWGGTGGGGYVSINVACFDANGVPTDTYFDLVYQAHSGTLGTSTRGLAFLWADQPSAASYTPSTSYQYNSTGGTNTMTRNGTGSYTALLPGLDKTGGHVQVSAYGGTAQRCKVAGWGSDGSGTSVNVLCFNAAGAAVDAYFTLEYSRNLPAAFLTTATTKSLYAWASQPANASYQVSGPYSYNGYDTTKVIANRTGAGTYNIPIPSSSYSSSQVLVTAYGTDNSYCNSSGWTPMYVTCYAQGGAATNSRFDASFLTH